MANALYDTGRAAFLGADIDWLVDNIKLYLVDNADYTVNLGTHDFADDVATAAKVATSGNFAGKTSTAGVADANDITLTAVSGDPCESIVIWKDTGTQSSSQLIAYIDSATGLAVTPNGGDITISWDSGANRIFKL